MWARVVTVASVLAAGLSPAGAARADSQPVQGWWSATTVSAVDASPVAVVPLPVPVAAPTAPDVPPDGLLVQGGISDAQPQALAALVYELPDGVTPAALTLTVTAASATTPSAVLKVCPLVSPAFTPVQAGPIAEAPAYTCTLTASAPPEADGTYHLDVHGMDRGGILAVALLPTTTTDRIVFDKPATGALSTNLAPPASAATEPPPTPSTAPPGAAPTTSSARARSASAAAAAPDGIVAPAATSTVSLPSVIVAPAPEVVPAPVAAPEVAAVPATAARAALASSAAPTRSTDHQPLVVVLLLLLAAGLWLFAGRRSAA